MISLLLPTRGRPDLARRFLDSAADHCQNRDDIEAVVYVDDDDIASHGISHPRIHVHRIVGPGVSMGTLNTRCLTESTGSIVVLANDDVVVGTDGWDARLREADARHRDGVYLAYPNDGFKRRSVATFPILSRRACEIIGRPYPVEYRGGLIDYHLLDIFKRLLHLGHDRICYLEDVLFEHRHYRTGKGEVDDTYTRRSRFGDDGVFVALRKERQSAAERLAAAIEGRPLPALVTAAPPAPAVSLLPAVARYASVFLGDGGLPAGWRTFLFAWYCARHFAAHGLGRPAAVE